MEIDSFLNEHTSADLSLPSPCEAELTLPNFNKDRDPVCRLRGRVIYTLLHGLIVR